VDVAGIRRHQQHVANVVGIDKSGGRHFADAHANFNRDRDDCFHPDADSHCDLNRDAHCDRDQNRDRDCDSHAEDPAHSHPDSHADSNRDGYANAYFGIDRVEDSDGDPNLEGSSPLIERRIEI
jgi:hypothetical protein